MLRESFSRHGGVVALSDGEGLLQLERPGPERPPLCGDHAVLQHQVELRRAAGDLAVALKGRGRGLFVRGADTVAHAVGAFSERTFVVVRFRPGAAASVLGFGGTQLADARVGISELWGRIEMERLESQLASVVSVDGAAAILECAVFARVCEPPDPAVEAVVATLREQCVPVRDLARRIGLSERQLRR